MKIQLLSLFSMFSVNTHAPCEQATPMCTDLDVSMKPKSFEYDYVCAVSYLSEETTSGYAQGHWPLVIGKELLCFCCTSTTNCFQRQTCSCGPSQCWQKSPLLSIFKPHVEGQSVLVGQRLVWGWGLWKLMAAI